MRTSYLRTSRLVPARCALAAVLGVALCLVPSQLVANPFELFGASARSGALGQAVTARTTDWSSLWHNPGGLGFAQPHMSMGTLMSFDDVGVDLKARPLGYDLPELGSASPAIPTAHRLTPRQSSDDISNLYDFALGAVGSFGFENLRVGVTVALPMTRLGQQNSHFADEREQYGSNRLNFELYGDRSQHQVILVGAGYKVLPWLSVGVAMSVMPKGTADSTVFLEDATQQENVRVSVHNEQLGRAAPILGLVAQPVEHLHLGLSWRSANWFELEIRNNIQIKGFQDDPGSFPVRQQVKMVLNSSPDQLAAGFAVDYRQWSVAADAVWSRWSEHVDTQGELAGFHDTMSIRAGAEYLAALDRTLRFGLQWEPSPVPQQTGRSSYVDNDRVAVTVGAGHRMEVFDQPVTLSWYFGFHHLLDRDTNKSAATTYPVCAPGVAGLCDEVPDETRDPATQQPVPAAQGLQTGSPGFPGWTSWGNLLALGLELQWRF